MHGLHAATSRVVNSAQGSSCKLKFVHDTDVNLNRNDLTMLPEMSIIFNFALFVIDTVAKYARAFFLAILYSLV